MVTPSYGYCPECGTDVTKRERRLNGNDTCANGHTFPSKKTMKERPALGPRLGYQTPDPKYSIVYKDNGTPCLVNAATGIEVEEPIFILRAKDRHALPTLLAYLDQLPKNDHHKAVYKRFLEFAAWQGENPTKEPDTHASNM